MTTSAVDAIPMPTFAQRRRTADRIFRGALVFNAALTIFWLFVVVTRRMRSFSAPTTSTGRQSAGFSVGVLFFYVIWGIHLVRDQDALLQAISSASTKEERRQAFSSRMDAPVRCRRVRLALFRAPHPHRRHDRTARPLHHARDGRLPLSLRPCGHEADAGFATIFLQDNLFDAVVTSWIFLGFYYVNGFLAARVLRPAVARHGRRARARELPAHHHAVDGRSSSSWSRSARNWRRVFPPEQFAAVFA